MMGLKQVFLKMPCQSLGQSTHNALPPTVLLRLCCLLTSDPGIERDAHTAVGVIGLHGNFPCTASTMTATERDEMLDTEYAEMCAEFLDVLTLQLHTEHVYFMTGSDINQARLNQEKAFCS